MANDKKTVQDRLAEEIDKAIKNAPDEDIMKEAEEAGDDIPGFATRMRTWLVEAKEQAGKIALEEAEAAITKDRSVRREKVATLKPAKHRNRPDTFMPDTVAARHGKKVSESDKKGIEEDLDDLFDDEAWPEKNGDNE